MLLNSSQGGINVFAKTDEASDLLNMTLCNIFQGSTLLKKSGCFLFTFIKATLCLLLHEFNQIACCDI